MTSNYLTETTTRAGLSDASVPLTPALSPRRGCTGDRDTSNGSRAGFRGRTFTHPLLGVRGTSVFALLLALVLTAGLQRAPAADEQNKPIGREEKVLVTITASVEAIDPAKREVTLKGPLGNTVTFTVDKRVKRLDEVKVGDLVRADYYVSFAAEVRKPTAEEAKHPLEVLEAGGKAPEGTDPAAGALRRFKVVTTIEGLDRPTQTVTVKGPMGRYLTARVADLSRLTQVRIGDTVVITYTEALAISLEKAEKKSAD